MSKLDTDGIKRAEAEVKSQAGLAPVSSAWQKFRRWLGIYTREEKEVMAYANRLKMKTIAVVSGNDILTERPDWMRKEDYDKLRSLAKKVERKKHRRK